VKGEAIKQPEAQKLEKEKKPAEKEEEKGQTLETPTPQTVQEAKGENMGEMLEEILMIEKVKQEVEEKSLAKLLITFYLHFLPQENLANNQEIDFNNYELLRFKLANNQFKNYNF